MVVVRCRKESESGHIVRGGSWYAMQGETGKRSEILGVKSDRLIFFAYLGGHGDDAGAGHCDSLHLDFDFYI